MTIKEAITKAVTERNATLAGKIVDTLRFQYRMNYNDIRATFAEMSGRPDLCTEAAFESLMYEADADY